MKSKIIVFSFILFISFAGTTGYAFGLSYFGYDEWGGSWHDADKTWTGDSMMCWAAAASNILAWTEWGYPLGQGFSGHDDMFGHFRNHWTDNGGWMEYGWNWWFDGTGPPPGDSYVDVPGGGNFWPTTHFGDYYYGLDYWDENTNSWSDDGSSALNEIETLLRGQYGVTLAIYGPGAHAVTVWGYEYDDQGNYLGIYITDSDDNADALVYVPLTYANNYWYLQGYGLGNWYIGAIQALDQKPVPEPTTFLLLISGLIGLAGFRRKFRKQ